MGSFLTITKETVKVNKKGKEERESTTVWKSIHLVPGDLDTIREVTGKLPEQETDPAPGEPAAET